MSKTLLVKKSFSAAAFALLFVFVPAIFEITYEKTMAFWLHQQDATEFFQYHRIEPAKTVFTKDEELKFVSFLDVHRKLNFRWNDILRCDYAGDDTGFTNVDSEYERADNPTIQEGKVAPWVWNGNKPQTPADCVLESNITAEVGYGVEKTQKIISDNFRIE